eukprot:Nk52_evm2s344 gene=Nk52_evmTU2s344
MVQGCSGLKCNARMFCRNILERSTCIETCRESLHKYAPNHETMKSVVRDRKARGREMAFYGWRPDAFPTEVGAKMVVFPPHDDCTTSTDFTRVVPGARCAPPTIDIHKSYWKGLKEYNYGVFLFANMFKLSLPQIESLFPKIQGITNSKEYPSKVCEWLREPSNLEKMKKIVPSRPALVKLSQRYGLASNSTSKVSRESTLRHIISITVSVVSTVRNLATITLRDETAIEKLAGRNPLAADTLADYEPFPDAKFVWPPGDNSSRTVSIHLKRGFREGRTIVLKAVHLINATVASTADETVLISLPHTERNGTLETWIIILLLASGLLLLALCFARLQSLKWVVNTNNIVIEEKQKDKKDKNTFRDIFASKVAVQSEPIKPQEVPVISGKSADGLSASFGKDQGQMTWFYNGQRCSIEKCNHPGFKLTAEIIAAMNLRQMCIHKNITYLIGATISPPDLCIISEYCARGSLVEVQAQMGPNFSWTFKLNIIMDVLTGLQFLHRSVLQAHGHLSSQNRLIDYSWTCKVSGFGFDEYKTISKQTLRKHLRKSLRESTVASSNSEMGGMAKASLSGVSPEEVASNPLAVERAREILYWAPEDVLKASVAKEQITETTKERIAGQIQYCDFLMKMDPYSIEKDATADIWSFGIILKELILEKLAEEWIPDSISYSEINDKDTHYQFTSPLFIAGQLHYNDVLINYPGTKVSMVSVDCSSIEGMLKGHVTEVQKDTLILCLEEALDMLPERRTNVKRMYQLFLATDSHLGQSNVADKLNEMLQEHTKNLEELVEIRTDSLHEEKAKVENLLCALLPRVIAYQLIRGESVKPETFDEITIFFSDIVGFTTICSKLKAVLVVDLLNRIYTTFDHLADT